jgi:hypothetical protein
MPSGSACGRRFPDVLIAGLRLDPWWIFDLAKRLVINGLRQEITAYPGACQGHSSAVPLDPTADFCTVKRTRFVFSAAERPWIADLRLLILDF